MDGYRTVAFIGHQPIRFRGYQWQWVVTEVRRVVLDATGAGVSRFIVGMDNGFALLAADTILGERSRGAPLSLVAAVPFQGQETSWDRYLQRHYQNTLAAADEVVMVSDEPYRSKEQYQQRNRWMVDHCDCLVAAYAGVKKSATYATIGYAQAQGRHVLLLDTVKGERRRWMRQTKNVR